MVRATKHGKLQIDLKRPRARPKLCLQQQEIVLKQKRNLEGKKQQMGEDEVMMGNLSAWDLKNTDL